MGLGWTSAYGAQGVQGYLHQRAQDQIAQQMRERQALEQDREFALRVQQMAMQQKNSQAQQARWGVEDQRAAQSAVQAQGNQLVDELSPNQSVSGQSAGVLRSSGRGDLIQENPDYAYPGFLRMDQSARDVNPGQQAGMVFTGTNAQKFQQSQADAATREKGIADDRANATFAETHRHNVAAENKPPAVMTVTTVDENGKPVTKVVPKVAGASYAKGPNATVANRLASASAVSQTGDDIIAHLSDPAFMAVVGPAMGRAGTLRDFIGNPPPEFSELAGQIESYALANMGVHGMRSSQGAEQIKHLLDQRHTPESLIATIKGLSKFSEHFIANESGAKKSDTAGAGGAVAMTAPDGRKLTVPAEKVAELEALGAKRQ